MCESNLTKESGNVKLEITSLNAEIDNWVALCKEIRNSLAEAIEKIVVLQKENFQLKVKLDRQSETPYDYKDRDEDLEEALPAFGGQVSDGDLSDMAHEAHVTTKEGM